MTSYTDWHDWLKTSADFAKRRRFVYGARVWILSGYIDQGRLKEEVRPEVQAWLDKVGEYNNKLVQPRMVKIGLPEFETDEAKNIYRQKEERYRQF